ncbi:MAG: hypothetical protein QXL51_01465 [Candidatus Aenigmatarchaeota archaeon]
MRCIYCGEECKEDISGYYWVCEKCNFIIEKCKCGERVLRFG